MGGGGLIQQVPLEASMGLAAGNSIFCHSCTGEQIELEIELIKDNFYNIIFHYNTIYLNIFFSLTMDIEYEDILTGQNLSSI